MYFVNNSTNQIDLSIYGAGNSNVFSNCTYNTGNSGHTYPYAVTPTTTNHYYSSVVCERYGTGAKVNYIVVQLQDHIVLYGVQKTIMDIDDCIKNLSN